MLLRVQYQDKRYDYVNPSTLEELITSKQIQKFYRPSEKDWIDIEQGPLRGAGSHYAGPERRLFRVSA
jgi:hypothetical protein